MNRSIKLAFIFIIALLFVVACTKTPATSKGKFVGGDKGLDISFIKDEPPEIIADNNQDQFDIGILLENVGEESIKAGEVIVTLNGIEKDAFSLSSLSAKNQDPIEGKKKLQDRILTGDQGEILFQNLKYKEQLPADMDIELRADVCYEYGTRTIADMCVKKEPNKRGTEDICEINDDSINVDNSGSPVKITNFIQRAGGTGKIKFTFDVEKTGGGDIFKPGTFSDKCVVNNDNDDNMDKADIEVKFSGSGAAASCILSGTRSSKGSIKLIGGKKTVMCEASAIAQDIAFRKQLSIKLDYVYKDSASKVFTVESSAP